ncbi:MAG: DUF1499 domain-containing protein [Gammaproteobacteria bacterium]|jgi:uncharacterized protein (DUF1499 family)
MTFVISLAAFVVVALIALSMVSHYSANPSDHGLRGGHLQSCPATPNCVVSEEVDGKNIEPLDIHGMDSATAWNKLKEAVVATGGKIHEDDGHYLWATYASTVFRFVDDFEARLDAENQLIQMRSASRVGHSDMGVNKARIKTIAANFLHNTL